MNNSISDEDQSNIKCLTHKGMPLIAIQLYEKQENQRIVCSKCIRKNNLECKELIFIDDIINSDENTIFENWPIQNQNDNILQDLQQIIESDKDQEDQISPSLIIQLFFDEFQKKIADKTNNCMKRILSDWESIFITKEKLLEVYNQLSQKQKLKEFIKSMKNQQVESLQNVDNLITQMINQSKDNLSTINQSIDLYHKTKEKLSLRLPNYYIEQILQSIDDIEEYFFDKNFSKLDDYLLNNNSPLSKSNQSSELLLKLINNKTNFCNDKFLNDMKAFLNQFSYGLNKISFQQIFQENKQPIEFYQLNQRQFEILEEQISALVKINNQFNNKFIDITSIYELQIEVINKQNDLSKFNEKFINQYLINHQGEIDKTFSCNFIKSKQDSYSLINQSIRRDSTNRIEIKQNKPGWQVQSYLDEVIDPFKKYILRIQFDPFPSNQQNYRFYIGIIEERFHESKWLDSSPFLFSNNPISGFSLNKVKKGLNINHQSIRYDKTMRFLEFQMCLNNKHFLIADYPQYNNITEGESEKLGQFSPQESYKLLIESESIQNIKIFYFSEVKEFPSFD